MEYSFAERFNGVTGSEIRKIFTLLTNPQIISLAGGNPSPSSFPSKEMEEISKELLCEIPDVVLQYGNTAGCAPMIECIKNKYKDIMKETDDVIMLTGSSQGIEMTARSLINPGDAMLCESPTFLGALQTFKLAQADVHMVDMEDDGVNLCDLEEKIKKYSPKFFYVIPTFQNPTGKTTSGEKRKAIYDICAKYGVIILEDDPYAELRYDGAPEKSIKSYDEDGIVIKLMSFSKTISPGLRVGAAIAHKDIIFKFNLAKQGMDVHTSNLSQYMVSRFIEKGLYDAHVKKICKSYKVQRDAMMEAVGKYFPEEVKVQKPNGGLFVWCELPESINATEIFPKCVEKNVAYVPGAPFYAHDPKFNTLRLNFSMPTVEKIDAGVKILGDILKGEMK